MPELGVHFKLTPGATHVSVQAHVKCTWREHDVHKGVYFSSNFTIGHLPQRDFPRNNVAGKTDRPDMTVSIIMHDTQPVD